MSDTPITAVSDIPLTLTPDSSKIHGYAYVINTRTLAVRFKNFGDQQPGQYTYHYRDVTPEAFAELEAADSKGAHITAVYVKTRWPFDKLLAEAPAQAAE